MNGRTHSLNVSCLLSLLALGCGADSPPEAATPAAPAAEDVASRGSNPMDQPDVASSPPSDTETAIPTWAEAPSRLVAIGDLHGDVVATRNVLVMAGVMDDQDRWSGEDTVVVQVGDQLDRGDSEREILHLLESLGEEAEAAGGAVYVLHGNHETMNVQLDLRYVTVGGFEDFADVPYDPLDPLYAQHPVAEAGRVAAFRPGGPYATLLSAHNTIMVVGDTIFVHGGVLPEHTSYGIDRINEEIRSWMRGDSPEPLSVASSSSPVWSRHYSDSPDLSDCLLLFEVLETLGLSRMVVAHTVQSQGISAACEQKVWRVDVGLASYYGGLPSALEIVGDVVTVLQE